jgi:hypothetical protein
MLLEERLVVAVLLWQQQQQARGYGANYWGYVAALPAADRVTCC